MLKIIRLSPALLAVAAIPVAAQSQEEEREETRPDPPIIVTSDPDDSPRRVALGSRIPRNAPFANSGIASNVGTPGLTPQSGMTPHTHNFIKRERKDCVSEDRELSKKVVCLLAAGEDLAAGGDLAGARDHFRHIAYTGSYTPHERHVASEKLYALARDADDASLREEALEAMLDTGELSPRRANEARRTLVALALGRGDTREAILQLKDVVAADPGDARSLANLAALQDADGLPEARETIRRAIAAQRAKGYSVPENWQRMAAGD